MTDDGLTRDVFLDGRLTIWQPRHGYRAATDPVLLAAAVPACAGQSVLELGCGAGVALFALGRRVAGLNLTGVERQADYAALARRNAEANTLTARIVTADLTELPHPLRIGFDHVLTNPPYYPVASPAARDAGRDAALREETPLALWLDQALRRVKSGGYLTLIHLAERLPGIVAALEGRAGAIAIRPIAAREGRAAGRILVQARKDARGPLRLLAPLIMHVGPHHTGDGDDFTPAARAILREAQPLGWD